MLTIRSIQMEDKDFWFKLDEHISEKEFENKVRDKMGYVLLENKLPIGLLRYNLFWDAIPFCTMLFIEQSYQEKGYGSKLMAFWEADIKKAGYDMSMTSTRADELAQHFYRKNGYQDAGALLLSIPPHEQPTELFFTKKL